MEQKIIEIAKLQNTSKTILDFGCGQKIFSRLLKNDKIINYEQVDPVPYKTTLAFINNFVINTTQFVNRFSYLAEQKLSDVSRDIHRLEITMSILEAKLDSIPGLENITAADLPPETTTSAQPTDQQAQPQAQQTQQAQPTQQSQAPLPGEEEEDFENDNNVPQG